MNKEPKLLLLCSFNQNKADGITIRNLFKGWSKERIALVEIKDNISDVYIEDIPKYYVLGNAEAAFVWPFNYLKKLPPSRSFSLSSRDEIPGRKREVNGRKRGCLRGMLLRFQRDFLIRTGLALISRRFQVSPEFDAWFQKFNPDVIYAPVGDIGRMELLLELQRRYAKRIVIHIFDDFINSRFNETVFPGYWRKRMDRTFRQLVDASDLCLAISEKMADEYSEKYGRPFYAFHNPIDSKVWGEGGAGGGINVEGREEHSSESRDLPVIQTLENTGNGNPRTFVFVYAGKVNRHTVRPIQQFFEATQSLSARGYPVELRIYSPYSKEEVCAELGENCSAAYRGKVGYEELPSVFRAADGLLLPMGFAWKTVQYHRLSMLTKVTEFMISGTPIFLFAPPGIAVSEYLVEHSAAVHCGAPSEVEEAILHFVVDAQVRKQISENAVRLARETHLAEVVNQRLKNLIAFGPVEVASVGQDQAR